MKEQIKNAYKSLIDIYGSETINMVISYSVFINQCNKHGIFNIVNDIKSLLD